MESVNYTAPQAKIIEVSAMQVICGSGMTEGFGRSDYNYGADKWN